MSLPGLGQGSLDYITTSLMSQKPHFQQEELFCSGGKTIKASIRQQPLQSDTKGFEDHRAHKLLQWEDLRVKLEHMSQAFKENKKALSSLK